MEHHKKTHFLSYLNIVVLLIIGCIILFSLTRDPIIIESPVVVLQQSQSTMFEATGYTIGQPYNTATKNSSPVITTEFIRIGGLRIFTVATDPKVIPTGSILLLDTLGIGLAYDTGRNIQGMRIDICFPSVKEALDWGRQSISVTVLRK